MRILQLCSKPPYPPTEGASIAMHNLCMGLIANGHQVDVLAINTFKQHCDIDTVPRGFVEQTNYTLFDVDIRIKALDAFLNLFSDKSYNITRFYDFNFELQLENILQKKTFDFILLETLFVTPYLNTLRKFHKGKVILRSHNVEFEIWNNMAGNEKNRIKKWYLGLLGSRLKKYELEILNQVDGIAAISQTDAEQFKKYDCNTSMSYIPLGINFSDSEFAKYSPPTAETICLFHVGSMDWLPHQEAFKWFLTEVLPKIQNRCPDLQLHLAGNNMPDWINEDASRNLTVTSGYVDGKKFMNDKSIMVVPSLSGSGIRVKIIEGLAKGKVVVTTNNGALGINCTNNENMFISDNADEWADFISSCVSDLEKVKMISKHARKFSEQEYGYRESANKLVIFYEEMVQGE